MHREARRTYARVTGELTEIVEEAQRALAGRGERHVVFNGSPHTRRGPPAGGARPADDYSSAHRAGDGGEEAVAVTERGPGGWTLDNGLVRVEVDGRGLVVSAYDRRARREAVAPGCPANLLQLHPDLPNHWDAWDVDAFYRHTATDLTHADEVTLAAADGRSATVRTRRSFGSSTVVQSVTLRAGSPLLLMEADVDWHESEKLLKAAFPLDVKADRSAAETQFGHVFRPTHTNTTWEAAWEAAKFEICAHRWLHVEEPGWGAALVNDSTYGHDVTRDIRADGGQTTTVRLSLLRAPRYPDPETDQGRHRMRYGLVPGAALRDAVREGHWINLPERTVPGDGSPVAPLVALGGEPGDQVVAETVKLADDGSGDVVVRLYESLGGRARALLAPGFPVTSVTETDLLERPLAEPRAQHTVEEAGVRVALRPFQILTLRLGRSGER